MSNGGDGVVRVQGGRVRGTVSRGSQLRIRAAALAAALLVVTGCSGGPASTGPAADGPLKPYRTFGVLAPMTSTDTAMSFGSMAICSDTPVVVTAATAVTSVGGATITAWGHRPSPVPNGGESLSADTRPLTLLGFAAGALTLPVGCDPPAPDQPEIAIQVARGPSGPASFVQGVRLSYTVDGQPKIADMPWTLGWCGTGNPEHCSDAG